MSEGSRAEPSRDKKQARRLPLPPVGPPAGGERERMRADGGGGMCACAGAGGGRVVPGSAGPGPAVGKADEELRAVTGFFLLCLRVVKVLLSLSTWAGSSSGYSAFHRGGERELCCG